LESGASLLHFARVILNFFASLKDVRKVRSINSWNLNLGFLKLFPWRKDFNP